MAQQNKAFKEATSADIARIARSRTSMANNLKKIVGQLPRGSQGKVHTPYKFMETWEAQAVVKEGTKVNPVWEFPDGSKACIHNPEGDVRVHVLRPTRGRVPAVGATAA